MPAGKRRPVEQPDAPSKKGKGAPPSTPNRTTEKWATLSLGTGSPAPSSASASPSQQATTAGSPSMSRSVSKVKVTKAAQVLAARCRAIIPLQDQGGLNGNHHADVEMRLALIFNSSIFGNVMTELALDITSGAKGATKASFKQKFFESAMKDSGEYEAGFNLLLLNLFWTPIANSRINVGAIRRLQNHFLKKRIKTMPKGWVFTVVAKDGDKPLDMHGGLHVLSPIEVLHAIVFAISDAIMEGAPDDELEDWKTCVLGATVIFKATGSWEENVQTSISIREATIATADEVARSTADRILEVVGFKAQKETLHGPVSLKDLESFYDEAGLAPNSEPVNYHFLDKAVTVYEAILSDPEKAEYIFAMDDQYGRNSPWNAGITKLQELVNKARMTDSISWCLGAMSFQLKEGYSHASDFTAVFLAGKKGEK